MKSSGIFLLTIHRIKQVKNDFKLKIFSLLYFFWALNVFEHLFNICKDVHFHGVFHFLFIHKGLQTIRPQACAQSVHKQSRPAHRRLLNLLINKASSQGFAQSVHKQSSHKRLPNLFINNKARRLC